MTRHFKQGRYIPRHPEKYIGSKLANGLPDIVYRSSWEKKVFIFFDLNPAIIKWNSENIIIPYFLESDQKMHRYFVDLIAMVKQKDDSIRTMLVEVKPLNQTVEPKLPKRKTQKALKNYADAILTYEKNQAKWKAAKEWASSKGWDFYVITEEEIFGKK